MLVKKGSPRAKKLPGPIAKRWKKAQSKEAEEDAQWAAVTARQEGAEKPGKAERKEAYLAKKRAEEELKAEESKKEEKNTEK